MQEAWDEKLGVEMGLIRKAIFVSGLVFAIPSPPATTQVGQTASVMPDATSWVVRTSLAKTIGVRVTGAGVESIGLVAVGKLDTSVRLRLQAALTKMIHSNNPLKRIHTPNMILFLIDQ